jgi:hypothetical protein
LPGKDNRASGFKSCRQWIRTSKLASALCPKKSKMMIRGRREKERRRITRPACLTGLHRHRLHLPRSRNRSSLDPPYNPRETLSICAANTNSIVDTMAAFTIPPEHACGSTSVDTVLSAHLRLLPRRIAHFPFILTRFFWSTPQPGAESNISRAIYLAKTRSRHCFEH